MNDGKCFLVGCLVGLLIGSIAWGGWWLVIR
jgi:hypothetical protein